MRKGDSLAAQRGPADIQPFASRSGLRGEGRATTMRSVIVNGVAPWISVKPNTNPDAFPGSLPFAQGSVLS